MPRAGPRKVQRYSLEFKRKAVKLSQLKDVEVQAVAEALEIHPFMLSRWRKQARDGVLRGSVALAATVTKAPSVGRDAALPGAPTCTRRAPGGARAAKKTHPVHLRTTAAIFAFIDQERERFGVTRLCRLFGVTRPGTTRGVSDRSARTRGRTGFCSKRCV